MKILKNDLYSSKMFRKLWKRRLCFWRSSELLGINNFIFLDFKLCMGDVKFPPSPGIHFPKNALCCAQYIALKKTELLIYTQMLHYEFIKTWLKTKIEFTAY